MLAWGALAGALGIDYWQHKRQRPTLCSTGRVVPKPVLYTGLAVGLAALLRHLERGYDRDFALVRIDLTRLTD